MFRICPSFSLFVCAVSRCRGHTVCQKELTDETTESTVDAYLQVSFPTSLIRPTLKKQYIMLHISINVLLVLLVCLSWENRSYDKTFTLTFWNISVSNTELASISAKSNETLSISLLSVRLAVLALRATNRIA